MAETLLKNETLNYKDVESLIGPPPYGKKKLIDPAEFDEMTEKSARDDGKADTSGNDSNNSKPTQSVSSA